LNLPSGATEIEITNLTDWGSANANTNVMIAQGRSSLLPGYGLVRYKTNGAATLGGTTADTMLTTGGFTFFSDSANQNLGAAVAITGINQINHPLALSATTGAIGDVVRVYGTTGMLQVAGMDFTVTAVNAGVSQTLGFLDASGFAAPATAGFYRRIPFAESDVLGVTIAPNPRYYPRARYITSITQAASAVITMSVTHHFQVGEKVRIVVPASFGMPEINNYLATVTAIAHSATVNSITVDFNSVGATAFAFPTSAIAALGTSFAMVIPVGEAAVNTIALPVGNLLDDRTRNVSMNGVIIGASALVASTNYQWIIKKGLVQQ
jgi:hypothetical protein